MPIRVTCPGCHVRFNVSEKFAGREGPCPKCKVVIRIPDKTEEVTIHAPEVVSKDKIGTPGDLKPIRRRETELSGVQITLIVGIIVLFLVSALAFRFMVPGVKPDQGEIFAWVMVTLLAVPCAFAGYTFLRDQERGSFLGRELWIRVAIAAAVYVLLWGSMWLSYYAFNNEWGSTTWFAAATFMLLAGGGVAMAAFDFEYLTGLLHYGMYFSCCLIARSAAGIGLFPGSSEVNSTQNTVEKTTAFIQQLGLENWWLG
jgi:hypothetical protein